MVQFNASTVEDVLASSWSTDRLRCAERLRHTVQLCEKSKRLRTELQKNVIFKFKLGDLQDVQYESFEREPDATRVESRAARGRSFERGVLPFMAAMLMFMDAIVVFLGAILTSLDVTHPHVSLRV